MKRKIKREQAKVRGELRQFNMKAYIQGSPK